MKNAKYRVFKGKGSQTPAFSTNWKFLAQCYASYGLPSSSRFPTSSPGSWPTPPRTPPTSADAQPLSPPEIPRAQATRQESDLSDRPSDPAPFVIVGGISRLAHSYRQAVKASVNVSLCHSQTVPAHQRKIRRFHRFLERQAFLQHCPYVLRQ